MRVIDLSQQNSLVNEYLRELRDVDVQKDRARFRRNLSRVAHAMAYEISKTLTYAPIEVTTPLEKMQMNRLQDELVLATVLRAGLPFFEGFLDCFDKADCAFISAQRKYKDEAKTQVEIECSYKAAPNLQDKVLVIVDPMLATGGSMFAAIESLKKNGTPRRIILACLVGAPEAIEALQQWLPNNEIDIYCASMDRQLNSHQYILPGLGDAGDLCYGDKL